VSAARLEDGAQVLHLTEANGWFVEQLDLGYPTVRAVVDVRAGADGTYDSTAYFGNRTVSMFLRAVGNRRVAFEQLSRFLRPITRPYLYFTVDGVERRIRLRANARSSAFAGTPNSQEFLAQWVAPDGVIEAVTETVAIAVATSGAEDGRTYDLTFDRSYAASDPVGSVTVTNAGTTFAQGLQFQLFGPCTNPEIDNLSTGEKLRFVTTLSAAQWLQINVRDKTVRLNGLASQNRYNTLDFAVSTWFELPPGVSLLRYSPDSSSAGSFARVSFRSSWI
jgi:hypothetical protein